MALAPESDAPKHRDRTKEQPKDVHSVKVEGMSAIFEDCPCFDMYLTGSSGSAKPVPFWGVRPVHVEEEANMKLIWVAVSVGVSTGIEGPLNLAASGEMLRSYISPESTVKVILPIYVNHRLLEFGDELRFYRPFVETEKKRKVEVADDLADFVKGRAAARQGGKRQAGARTRS